MVPPANPSPIRNGISISSAVFAQLMAESPYTLQWAAPSPSKLTFTWGIWTPSNTCDRCFAAAGPRLWNTLPIQLRHCDSLGQFKRLLKTYLFGGWDHGAL